MQNKLSGKTPQNTGSNGPTATAIPATHLQNKGNFPQDSQGPYGPKAASQSHELGPEDGKN